MTGDHRRWDEIQVAPLVDASKRKLAGPGYPLCRPSRSYDGWLTCAAG
jgi:hypothetical protein